MNGVYLLPFPLEGESGKNRATRQKADALANEVGSLTVVFPSARSLTLRALQILANEIKVSWCILSNRNELDFLITRGLAGFMCVPLARMFQVRTLREVHSISSQESRYVNGGALKKRFVQMLGMVDTIVSRSSDTRIFNHPSLQRHFEEKGWLKKRDFFCYNGGAPQDALKISRDEARSALGLPNDKKILAFVGSASAWHGIEFLVALGKEIEKTRKDIIVVCGGGDISAYDPECRILNITPLDSEGSAKLVRASDACLLPVRNIRISPGSPLKLYDYVLNGRPVIAQKGVLGYEDEVENLGVGLAVDFASPQSAAEQVCRFIDADFEMPSFEVLVEKVSWRSRMRCWIRNAFDDRLF